MGGVVFSPYVIMWAEVRPNSGRIVRKRDARVMGLTTHWNGYGYRHFSNRDSADRWLTEQKSKQLSKEYSVRFFTDKQFGLASKENNYAIPFTSKQWDEVTII